MLDWIKKDGGRPDRAMRSPAAAAKPLSDAHGADPLAALNDLGARLEAVKGLREENVRCDALSLIQEASAAHLSALLAQILAKPPGGRAARESAWNALVDYSRRLTGALCVSASTLLKESAANPSLRLSAVAGAARGLHACRVLAKVCLVRYVSVPTKLWRVAYAIHGEAERANCAGTPVRLKAAQNTLTSVTQELLKLLILQSSSPEMMAPEQIEVADRIIGQLGEGFALRPPGVADNVFCFDPASERPPFRTGGRPPSGEIRSFGAGTAYDALDRLYRQFATTRTEDVKAFGADISPHAQISAMQHLLAFWSEACPYSPPVRSPATGSLQVVHGYGQIWQHLSRARAGKTELTLVEDGDSAPQAPETWTLRDVGGNELGAEIPQQSGQWARCGDVVAVWMQGAGECWLGVIRSLRGEWGRSLRGEIAILSRDSRAVQLHAVIAKGEETAVSEEAARQFNFNGVRAIILSDGSDAQRPDLLVPPERWKRGCVFESAEEGGARYLRGLKVRQRGDDYVRATFERVAEV